MSQLQLGFMMSSFNVFQWLLKYINIILMKFLIKGILLLLILISTYSQAPTAACPLLCATNCTSGTICSSCYANFTTQSAITSSCTCPQSMFLDSSTLLCKPCPINCVACSNYSVCTSCVTGFILKNNYSCLLNSTNVNGWVSKNVTYQLTTPDFTGVSGLVVMTNGTALNLSNNLTSLAGLLSNCAKLGSFSWLGGYQSFGYKTKIIKTVFNLPPHQWLNIMFQAILIDSWFNNTLLLEINNQQSYNPNTLQNPTVIWSAMFDSRVRKFDFCGSNTTGDNLVVANSWLAHNASSLKLQIRLNQSQTITDPNQNLNTLYYGIRQFFIRVGTCGRYCQFCSHPNVCTKCAPPYVLVNGQCTCYTTLTLGFPTLTGCSPSCVDGEYYNSTASDCLSCSDQYDNCRTCDVKTCLTCNPGYLYYTDSMGKVQCLRFCPDNFTHFRRYLYNTSVVVNTTVQNISQQRDQCVPCPANCVNCNPNNICIFCAAGYLYHKGSCFSICPAGYYNLDSNCVLCSLNCSTCNYNGCTVCADGFRMQNNKCYRACANSTTLLVSGSDSCNLVCSSPCLTCFGSANINCLSCPSGSFLANSSCVSVCPTGTYANGSTCTLCSQGCGSCNNSTVCLTCASGFYLWNSQCVRTCPPLYYPFANDSSNSSTNVIGNQCMACQSGCVRCSDANTCLVCAKDYYFFNFTCLEDQPDEYQQYSSNYRKCSPNCLKCTHRVCTRCAQNFYLNQGLCVQTCPPEKYPSSTIKYDGHSYMENICAWKNPLCAIYNSTLQDGSCSQCSLTFPAALLRQGWRNEPAFVCTLTCPQFYVKAENLSCVACPNKCLRCFANMTCLQCIDGYSINHANLLTSSNLMNQTCLLNVCPQFYFSDSLQCQSCPQNCRICLLDNSCFICDTNYVLDPISHLCVSNNCSQISQFYNINTSSCLACSSNCRSCFGLATTCTSCPVASSTSNQTYLFNDTCILSCPSRYFAHKHSLSCRLCNPRCDSCLNFDNCLTCKPNFFILSFYSPQNVLCVAECPIGFWTNTTICQRCSPDCKTCYGPSQYQCLSCYPNFYLDEYRCVYSCSPMKYKDNQGHCDWCHPSCQECTGPSKYDCINCLQGQFYYDHRCFNKQCPGATYLSIPSQRICQPCQFGCQYCSSSQFCYFCTPGYKFYKGWCYNQCPGNLAATYSRYYMLLEGQICKSCYYGFSSKCLRCSPRQCKRCKQGYYLYRLGANYTVTENGVQVVEQCFTACPSGTYLRIEGGRECLNCQIGCSSCVSYSNCTSCSFGYNLINGYCSQSCPAFTFQLSSGFCMNCPDQCLSCTSLVYCTACKPNYYLYVSSTYMTSTCVSTCPNTYYGDQSGWCLRCPSTCVTCYNATSCTACAAGYTFTNGACTNSSSNCIANCVSCSGGICRACNGTTLLYINPINGSTQCVLSCPIGWFAFAGRCLICNQTCATCSNTQNNCTTCVAGLFLYRQICVPACPSGFFAQTTTLICKPCTSNCINCNNGSCTLCASGFFLYQGVCNNTCPPSTFASLSTLNCFSCNQNCAVCQDIENCTTCSSGYSLYNLSCISKCPSTTYVLATQNGQICMPCVSPCFTCNSPNTCLSCIATYILNGTNCQQNCGTGFYLQSYYISYEDDVDDQDFSTFQQCLPCHVQCLTCKDYGSRCVTCAVGFVLANGRCLRSCPDGTFNSSSVCMPCSSYCVTCSNINICAVCVQGTVLYNGLCLSNCPQGNYMVLNSTAAVSYYYCAGCSPSCQSCNGSTQYNCLSCNQGYFLSNGMCLQACPQGTYASNLTRRCSPCPVTCTNCTSFSNCGGCIANYTLSNTNQCNPPNSILCNVSFCVSCSPTNSSQCQQCILNYYLLTNGTCSLTCPTSTFAQIGQCINCPSTCTSCTPTQCTACLTNYYLYNGICYSSCPISTLPNQNTCIPDPCLYYNTSSPFSCLACTTPYLLAVTNSSTGYQSCVSSCPIGTVQSGSQCITCPVNCVNCQTSSSCLVCNNNTYLANGQCVYNCPVGTYPSNSVCQSCNISFCLQCKGPNNCSKCSPQSNTYLYNGQCYLNCPVGTFSDFSSGLCINCVTPCLQCTSPTACTSCVSNYYLYQSTCLSVCPLGTYNASTATSKICNNCSVGCNNCTSATNCSFCQSGYLLFYSQGQGSCITTCSSGFYAGMVSSSTFTNSNQYQCLVCVSPCATCSSETTCVTCLSGYYFYRGTCVTACPSGFYAGSTVSSSGTSQSNCLACDSSCLTCQNTSTFCTSCAAGYNLDSQGNCNSNCSSPSTYYVLTTRQCLNCSGSCYTCQGPLSTDCLSCRPPLSLYSGQCVTNCPFGYYSTSTYVCKQCSSPCASCLISATNCTSCVSPYLIQSSNTGMLCVLNCLTSFYPNTTVQMCYPCNSTCLTCSGPAYNQCTSCPSSSLLLQGSCINSCPSGTVLMQQGSQSICQACSSGCSNCSVSSTSSLSTICTQCLPNYYLYKGICFTACPPGTYASPTSFTCNLCNLLGCQTCIFNTSMSVQCTSCQAGYYALGDTGTCVASCPTGYTLVNSQCVVIPVCQGYTYNSLCVMNCPQSTYTITSPSKSCVNCSANCVSCTNGSVCLQCSNNTYVYYSSTNSSSCVSYCPSGLYADSNIGRCSACGNNCSTCYQQSNLVVCSSCQSGYVLLGSQCVQSCPVGYYQSTSNVCQLCSSVCYSCNVTSTNCTLCKNINYTTPNCASANCTASQYLTAAGTCSNCNAACATCYGGNSYQCITCSNNTYNLNGQCLQACAQGYTADANRNCVACPSNCASCASNICDYCNTGYFMAMTTRACVSNCSLLNTINQTYYTNASFCYTCSLTNCYECEVINSVRCKTCQSNSYNYSNQCITACPIGTYASVNPNLCNNCPTNCTTCASASTCTECSSGFALLNAVCTSTCPSGYYLSTTGSITRCNTCSAQCLVCSSPTNCTVCSQPYTLVNGQCSGCLTGYYFSLSTNTCLICSSSCANCSLQSTNCTSCASGYSLLNSNTCVTNCPVGYYSLNSVCMSCSTANCAICASNICSACQGGFVQTIVSGVVTCSSNCSASTFLNSATNTCINCSSNCLSCTSATTCLQCNNSSYLLYLGYCITSCPSGFTANNGTCVSCPVNCKLCSSLTNCTICVSSVYVIVNGSCTMNSTVNCTTGYYVNSFGNCSQCYPTCQTCNGGSASNCLTCFSGSTLINGVCQLNCAVGSFFNSNTSSCQQCSTLFTNCVSCSSTGCTACSGNYTLVGSTCTLSCPSGTYLTNQQCYSCSSYCAICTSSNNCTQCINSTFILYNGSCSSSCPVTTYQNGLTCSPCFQTCLTCTTSSSTNCLSCITPYNLYVNSCVVSCPNGTYAQNNTCQPCSTNCLMCSSTGCTQCASSYYLINGTCRSTCPSGYYIDSTSSSCVACVQPCSQCTSRTNCTACISSYNLNSNTCIGQCPAGQYYNSSLSACINCSMTNCGYCNSTYCSVCLSSYYSYYSNGSISACISNCSNIQGTFNDNINMNCSSCYINCQSCTNSTYCTLCASNYYLLQVAGVNVNQCVTICPLGYYATLLRTCLPCASNCNVCINSTYCSVCASNYYLFTSQTSNTSTLSCVSQCPTGYSNPTVIDGTGQCILCSTNCIACVDVNTCTQCVSSVYAISNGQCIPYNCLNCQNCDTANNVCLNCTSPYFLSNKGCVAFCPNGQYGDNSTGQCTKCMSNCLLCFNATTCTQCATNYVFVQASRTCENQGFVDFGAIGNMSGFTSNITQVMATVYVSTSAGPIAFGALSNTYGMMQVCQFMYFLQGSCGDNPELTNFLNSLSMVSYSQNPNNQQNSTNSTSRLLTGIDYTSSFLQTNLPIFLMMIGFVSAYILVILFSKYNESCCINYPTARKYVSYICEFMQKRFKYIYVDCVMWISYLPFLYFSILQLQKLAFNSALNAISTILAFIIIIIYPLYPVFILRKIFDKSDKPEEHLKNYAAITLRLPLDEEEQAKRPMCQGFTCCPKQNPDVSMVEMSLSPWIDSVVRPVYNQDVPEYREFKYFSIPHFRLAYAAIKYIRKFIFVLVAAVCPDPITTVATLIVLSIVYMLYLIILKPKKKLYLILEIILETLILFFLVFMLIYLKVGGATVTAMSVIAHAIGFALANSSLAIAIILNIMAYYTIICCLIDLVRHMRNKAEADDLKEKKQQFQAEIYPQVLNEKDDLPIDGYYGDDPQGAEHMDLEKDLIKKIQAEDKELDLKEKKKKGDDELTEENNDDYQADHYDLDEKEFNVRSSMINKKKSESKIEADEIPTLNQSQNRRKKRQVIKEPEPKYEVNTEDQIMMGISKVSQDSNVDVNDGLLKQRENDKYRRKVGNNQLNVDKGILKQVTDKFRRNPKHKNTVELKPEQESMDYLYGSPNIKPARKEEQVQDINTHDRIKNTDDDKRIAEAEVISRKVKPKEKTKVNELDEVQMRQRERLEKEKTIKAQEQLEIAKMREREKYKKIVQDPFGDFDQILDPKSNNNFEDLAIIERERKAKEISRNKEKQVSEFLPDQDGFAIVQRKPQPKKQKNEFYKGSDEQGELGEVKYKDRQTNKFKRNLRNQEKPQQESYEALGKDIYTKKADKKKSAREFAQDNTDELTYKEREGRGVNKKPTSIQEKQTYDLQQAQGLERQKRKAQKSNKPTSIYNNIQEPLAESITFAPEAKVKQQKSFNDPDFEEENMQKQRKQRENAAKRQKDNKLQIGSNLQESYDDVVNKNKQQIFKPDVARTAKLLDIEGDGFEEESYAPRPESKMERPKSRSKDMGLAATSKAQDSQDDSYDTRKQRNLASQRLRKKGNLQMSEEMKVEQESASRDSRRVSKVKEKKLKVKSGVLNIEDNSDSEDIEQFRFG